MIPTIFITLYVIITLIAARIGYQIEFKNSHSSISQCEHSALIAAISWPLMLIVTILCIITYIPMKIIAYIITTPLDDFLKFGRNK